MGPPWKKRIAAREVCAGRERSGTEELAVEVQAVDGGEEDLAGRNEGCGIVGGGDLGEYRGDSAVVVDEGRMHGHVRVGDERGDGSVGGDLRVSFDAFAVGDFDGLVGVREIDAPEVAAVLIEGGRLEPAASLSGAGRWQTPGWSCRPGSGGRC